METAFACDINRFFDSVSSVEYLTSKSDQNIFNINVNFKKKSILYIAGDRQVI